jgi:hypothetical protein
MGLQILCKKNIVEMAQLLLESGEIWIEQRALGFNYDNLRSYV